jgi:hypothetical protein
MVAMAALGALAGGEFPYYLDGRPQEEPKDHPRPMRHRPGPCEVCGKPNVKAGRERGVYRCAEHMGTVMSAEGTL